MEVPEGSKPMNKDNKSTAQAGQTIRSLRIKNMARITHVEVLPPADGAIIISGKNAAGKTTLINSIVAAMGGKVPALRDGQEKGEIDLETDQLKIRVIRTKERTKLIVTDKATNHSLRGPKTILKKLFGKRSFDATEFLLSKEKKQAEVLLNVLNLDGSKERVAKICNDDDIEIRGESITEWINDGYDQVYQARRITNRKAKEIHGLVSEFIDIKDVEPVDLEELYKLKTQAIKKKAMAGEIEALKREITRLADLLEHESLRLADMINIQKEMGPYTEAEVDEQITQAKEQNRLAANCQEKKRGIRELERLSKDAAAMTEVLTKLGDYKNEVMDAATLPIPGLDVQGGEIFYNGYPLKNSSGAEQVKVAISIARQEIPEDGLQALFVLDPPQLDKHSWKIIEEYAKGAGVQLWIARVSDDDEGKRDEVHLVEGSIANEKNL